MKLAQDTLTLEHSNRARDVSGDVDYTHTGPDNTFGVGAAFDLPFHDRNQGNIARSEVRCGRPPNRSWPRATSCITDVSRPTPQLQTNQKVVATLPVRLSRSGEAVARHHDATCTSGAPARCSICWMPSGRIGDTQLGYRQALAAYMTSVQQINFAVGKQVIAMRQSASHGRGPLAIALAACGGRPGEQSPAQKAAAAAPAAGGDSPAIDAAAYFTVPPDQLAHFRWRRSASDLVDDAPHHRHGRLGQRPHDAGDHPGQRTDHAHSRRHRARR